MYKGVVITPSDLIGVDWPEKMQKLGLNTLGVHSGGGATHEVLSVLEPTLKKDFRDTLAAGNIDLEFELHAAGNLMPRENFEKNPSHFVHPIRSNERQPVGNWCCSHGALDIVAANAQNLANQLQPTTHRHFYWGEDGAFGTWCHCDDCAHLTESEQNLLSVNAMATQLRKSDPDAKVAYLAYCGSLVAPVQVKPAPGVFLEFAPFERCFRHRIDDPNCTANRKHWNALLDLLKVFPAEDVHVLEYFLDSSLFSGWKKPAVNPPVSAEIMKSDMKAYRQLGIKSITTFAVYMDGEFFDRFGDQKLCEYAEALAAAE